MQRLLSSIVAVAAGCSNIGNTLNRGSRLYEGSCFKAHGPNNGVYITQVKAHTSGTALVQEYCNSAGQCQVLWASHSGSDLRQGPYNLYMQYDFNVCLYSNAGSAVWCTNTKGKGNVGHLVQQTDSNLVLYNGDNVPKWNSGKHLSAVTQSEEVANSGSCPFANKCVNSHGACAVCNKSPWYDSDGKCVCGTSDADWITADQCSQCSDELTQSEEEVVSSGSCPFANKCLNSHGACAVCNKSPWYDSDGKCVCGTSDADWITADQCSQCSDEALTQSEEEVVSSGSCPFANKCVNSHGACAVCNKSPWYDSDGKCVCGTSDADWITADQCSQCSDEALIQSEEVVTSGSCPFANKCVNSHGACAVCNKSPWFDSDHKCVCGTDAADWITADQCSQCSDEALTQSEEVGTSESCPFANKCVNSHGTCAVCNKSPWYESDHKCVCGTSDADWITADQCSQCSDEALTQSEILV